MAGKRRKVHPDTRVVIPDLAELKKEFLKYLRQGGIIGWAASKVNRDRRTILEWRHADPEFDAEVIEAQDHSTEMLKESVYIRAMNPHDRMSAVLAMFELKRRDPTYRDRLTIDGRHLHAGHITSGGKPTRDMRDLLKGVTKDSLQALAERIANQQQEKHDAIISGSEPPDTDTSPTT